MNNISSDVVKKLREETGHGIMACKKALADSKGDFQKAKKILEEKIEEIVEIKSERLTGAGVIDAYEHDCRVGVIVEVACESDFVARNEDFKNFVHDLSLQIASMAPKDIEELISQNFIKDESKTIEQLLKEIIAKTGENIKIIRFERFELGK